MSFNRLKAEFLTERIMSFLMCLQFFLLAVGTSPAEAMAALILVLWVLSGQALRDWGDRNNWLKARWTLPVLIMAALPFIGMLYTPDMDAAIEFAHKSRYWLYAFPAAAIIYRHRSFQACALAFIGGLSLNAFIALAQFAGLMPLKDGVYASGMMSHIVVSLFYVFGLLLLGHFISRSVDRVRWMYLGISLVLLAALAVSSGRSGLLALILLWPLWVYRVVGIKRAVLGGVIVLLALVAVTFTPQVQQRLKQARDEVSMYKTEGKVNTSVGARLYMWQGAIKIISEHPLKGVGTGGYRVAMSSLEETPMGWPLEHPHNSFLHMAVSYGILGLAVFVWLLTALIREGWRRRASLEGYAVVCYTLVFIVGSFTDTLVMSLSTCVLLALMAGLGGVSSAEGV